MQKNFTGGHKIDLLYILGTFPVLSETFIQREVLEILRDRSLNVRVISCRKGDESVPLPPELKSKILYFSNPGRLKLLISNVPTFFRNPIKYLSLVRLILFGKHSRPFLKIVDLNALLIGGALSNEIRNLDIGHIHAPWATWPATIALVLSRLQDVPFSFTAHAHDIYKDQMLLKEKISLSRAVITISKFNQNYLRGLVPSRDRSKISLIYLGVNFKDLRFSKKRKADEVPLILAVGRLISYKGFSYLIDALDFVKRQGGNFRAVIIGGGPEFQHLKRKIVKKNLTGHVKLLGALPFEEVKNYFEKSDVFVTPSVIEPLGKFDGIPVVLFEAMSAKVPIISTRILGIPEVVKDWENGLLVEERDAEALAKAISTLLNDRKLRERFGEVGFRRAQKMFNLQKNAQHFKKAILGGNSVVKGEDYRPEVSVIIPTYNRARLIPRAIQSVLNQTYQDLEFIVVDDASTDDTKEKVKHFFGSDMRVKYFRHGINKGASAARNTGLKNATGKYVAFLDSDDEWLPEKLEKQLKVFKEVQDNKLGFVYCGVVYIKDNQKEGEQLPKKRGYILEDLLKRNCVIGGGSSPLIKKEVFDQCGLFDECEELRKGGAEDREMWIRISKEYNFSFTNEFLVRYYIHASSAMQTIKLEDRAKAYEYIISKFSEDYERVPKILSGMLCRIANLYYQEGDINKGREVFRDSIETNFLNARSYFHFLLSLFGSDLYQKMFRVGSTLYRKMLPFSLRNRWGFWWVN